MLPPDPGPLAFLFNWLSGTSWASAIAEGALLFPWIETVHVLCLTLVFGTIAVVDLRLLGWQSTHRPVRVLERELVPVTWAAFAGAALTGFLLFASSAGKYAANPMFQAKMLLLALAGVNMAVFNFGIGRSVGRWGDDIRPPLAARVAGGLSLILWTAIIVVARWIGFSS
ncbi:DUF6644 family protein [Novosphingobium rosa]|uniref:DUF6644 family protein n=1 Tax=Novosphingobium rosa TaxID=76978 RepID=UPI000A019AEF|nr:DUF6644 family protein [Novosphingobium rosa]